MSNVAHEWLIRKNGYYYRPNKRGYTSSVFEAGRYTEDDAKSEAAVEPDTMTAIHISEVQPRTPTMTNTDTVERLRELRAKATLGKWKTHKDCPECIIAPDDANNWAIARCDDDAGFNSYGDDVSDQSNAALIVAAINALPALLDAVEALEKIKALSDKEGACSMTTGDRMDMNTRTLDWVNILERTLYECDRAATAALATLKGEG